jgi:hypothetical protein
MSAPTSPQRAGHPPDRLQGQGVHRDLLKENERLRFKIGLRGVGRPGRDEPRHNARIARARGEAGRDQARYRKVEAENKEFADRYLEIEEQNNNLANLYVASYQLHSTLDYKEVVRIVQEIVINLIGAEVFTCSW